MLFFGKKKNYVDVTGLARGSKKDRRTVRKIRKPVLKKTNIKPFLRITPSVNNVEKKVKRLKPKPQAVAKPPKEVLAGEVTHFFDKIKVCVLKLKNPLKVGDTLRFVSRAGDFIQKVDSMQINHAQVSSAKKGDEIGLKIIREVGAGDKVFMV